MNRQFILFYCSPGHHIIIMREGGGGGGGRGRLISTFQINGGLNFYAVDKNEYIYMNGSPSE